MKHFKEHKQLNFAEYQPLNYFIEFSYPFWRSRKWLLIQGFEFVNPENGKF